MFTFADSVAFYLMLLLPVLVVIYIYTSLRARRRLARFGRPQLLHRLTPGYSRARPWVKLALQLSAVALIVMMIARPQWGENRVTDESRGIEVAVMVDVSNSMYAQDVRPSRMERTRLLLSTLIDQMKNDRVSIGIFAGEAYPQLPITNDYASAKMFVDQLAPGMVTCQGTDFAAAIRLAAASFTDNKDVGKAILLITDGENHEEDAEQAAAEAAKNGIRVYVLGVGTAAGAPIPLPTGGVLDDEEGKPVHTALDEATCRQIAKAGGGEYYHVDETHHAQELLVGEWRKFRQSTTTASYTEADEQFQAIALIVLILLIAECFVMECEPAWSIWRRRGGTRK